MIVYSNFIGNYYIGGERMRNGYALRAVRFNVLVGFIAGVNVELVSLTCIYDMDTNGGGGREIRSVCSNKGEDLEVLGCSLSNADRRFNIIPVHGVLVSLSIGSLVV